MDQRLPDGLGARRPEMPPLDRLERTHQEMLGMLGTLETLLDRLDTVGPDRTAQMLAAQVHAFFDEVGHTHHAQEEQHVFPPLLSSGDEHLAAQVAQLRQDHGWIEENWHELGPQLDALARGHSWVDPDMLRHMIQIFSTLHHAHIALEESLVYPEARRRDAQAEQQAAQRQAHWATS